jgi:hypothetical protein
VSWPTVANVETHHSKTPELVPVEALRSGDPITDVNGGGQHYIVLESKVLGGGCVVLELESKANDRLRVIEMSFPSGYEMGRSPRRIL